MTVPQLVLASTSIYRRELLTRLGLPFTVAPPATDETPLANETPLNTATRLSHLKAASLAAQFPYALIIGSDQVASLNGSPIGKPGDHAAAVMQLQRMRGQSLLFHTGLCLFNTVTGTMQNHVTTTTVRIRMLTDAQIEHYLRKDQPYHCAGSARVESLGIAIMDSVCDDDPTALIGLPLIALTHMLAHAGVDVLMAPVEPISG